MGTTNEKLVVANPSGGVVYDMPKAIIGDGQWTDVYNVRFKNGSISKVEGYKPFRDLKLPEHAVWIDNYYRTDDEGWLMFVTTKGFYYYEEATGEIIDITDEELHIDPYEFTGLGEVTDDLFLFTNLNDPIWYWDGIQDKVMKLPGLFEPPTWAPGMEIKAGDYIKPTTAYLDPSIDARDRRPYTYKAQFGGTTGSTEPVWPTSGGINDNEVRWELVGTYGLEGTTATEVTAKYMLKYKGFLILGHTIENGTPCPLRVRWSQYGNVMRWINDPFYESGMAGYFDFDEGSDYVQALCPLGDYLVIYRDRSIYVLSFVGGDLIWERRSSVFGVGLLAPNAFIDLGDEHIFVGPDNIYSFDLHDARIAGGDISKEFFTISDPSYHGRITAFYNEEVPEAWFCFHSTTNPWILAGEEDDPPFDKAIVYNVDTKAWSIRDMTMAAFGYYYQEESRIIDSIEEPIQSYNERFDSARNLRNAPINLVCDKEGYLHTLDGHSYNGGDINAWATSKHFDFDKPEILKRVKRIQVMTSRGGDFNLEIYVGAAQSSEDEPTWYGPFNMNLSQLKPPWADMDISGRYICIKFQTRHAEEPFNITGYQIMYQERGDI